jgi:hypothetical protein
LVTTSVARPSFSQEFGNKGGSGLTRKDTWSEKFPPSTRGLSEPEAHKTSKYRKAARAWKPKKTRRRLVIGMDVGLEETCQLALCALVGRFAYKRKCDLSFIDWMKEVWLTRLGYIPTYTTLTCGWFSLLFKTPEDAESILTSVLGLQGW